MHSALSEVFEQQDQVKLPPPALERLSELLGLREVEKPPQGWRDVLPENFQLPIPTAENIGQWLQVIESWVTASLHALGALERVALELLVESEALVRRTYLERGQLEAAPAPPVVPGRYQTLARGQERSRQRRLDWWDRFQTADGIVPSLARFLVAGAVLAGVLGFAHATTTSELKLVNRLPERVLVEVEGQSVWLEPFEKRELRVQERRVQVTSRRQGREVVDTFEADTERGGRYAVGQGL